MAGQYLGPSQATTEHPWHRPNQPIGEDNPTERRVAHYKHCGPMRPDEPFRLQQHHNTDHHPSSTSSPEAEDGAKQHLQLPLRRLAPGRSTRQPTSHPPPPMWCTQHHAPHISVTQKLQGLCPALLWVIVDPCKGAGRHSYVTSVATSHSTNEEPTRRIKNPPALLSLATRMRTFEGPQSAQYTFHTHHASFNSYS